MWVLKVKVTSLPYIFQVLYVLCFTRPRYQVSVNRTIGPLVLKCGIRVLLAMSAGIRLNQVMKWASLWENRIFEYAKIKTHISFAVTAKLTSAFVFATRILLSLYCLNPKFQASSHLLWLYSPVCVGPGRKPRRPVFSKRGSNRTKLISSSNRNKMQRNSKTLHYDNAPIQYILIFYDSKKIIFRWKIVIFFIYFHKT